MTNIEEIYPKIQQITKCKVTKLDAIGDILAHYMFNSQLQKTKELSANLKINTLTERVNVGTWGLFYNSYAANVYHDKINIPKKKLTLIKGRYK